MATSLRDRLIGLAQKKTPTMGLAPAKPPGAAAAPVRPPSGYYDPTIDATERAGARGVGDLRIDTETANQRAGTALVTNRERLTQDRDTSLAGLLASKTRGLEDIGTSRRRGGEDFATGNEARRRSYGQLGDRQAEGAQAAGVSGGGALAAALAKRLENEGIDQAGANRDFSRFNEDLGSSESRLGQDYATGVAGVQRGFDRASADEGTNYQYGVDDRALGLGRAEREQVFTGADAGNLRSFQAAAAGWSPPAPAKKPAAKKKGKK